jgi:hypothetical protein
MSDTGRAGKKAVIDKRIEEFCQTSAELISNIHDRCNKNGKGAKPQKAKKGRKKKEVKEPPIEELVIEDSPI